MTRLPKKIRLHPAASIAIGVFATIAVLAGLRSLGVLSALSARQLESPKFVEQIEQDSGQWQIPSKQAFFRNKPLNVPQNQPFIAERGPNVLAAVPGDSKWIEVDLSDQKLKAWEGDKLIYEFTVSTGRRWTPTPVGEFRIWIKLRYHTMIGGSPAWGNYYNLPNVPFVMYFYKGYGLHGTYWHNNFGTPMSHGCVNLRTPDAEKLFWWTQPSYKAGSWSTRPSEQDPGTRVIIHK